MLTFLHVSYFTGISGITHKWGKICSVCLLFCFVFLGTSVRLSRYCNELLFHCLLFRINLVIFFKATHFFPINVENEKLNIYLITSSYFRKRSNPGNLVIKLQITYLLLLSGLRE